MKVKLQSIARQKSEDIVMEELFAGEITMEEGLQGDGTAACAPGEISVLSKESWVKVCHETDLEVPWLAGGANLLIRGFEFLPTDVGKTLRIGEAVLEIHRENTNNEHVEGQAPEFVDALKLGWRAGVICKVLRSGSIKSGDDVEIVG